jgi:hypothetical protein
VKLFQYLLHWRFPKVVPMGAIVRNTDEVGTSDDRGCYYRKWLIGKTRTERVLFSGSAKFGSGGWYCRGCYYDLIPKSYWGMSNAYYPMKLTDCCMKYNKYYRERTDTLQIKRTFKGNTHSNLNTMYGLIWLFEIKESNRKLTIYAIKICVSIALAREKLKCLSFQNISEF